MLYLDTSALFKTIVLEPESPALRAWLSRRRSTVRICSALLKTELPRAIAFAAERHDLDTGVVSQSFESARRRIASVRLVALTDDVLECAGALAPAGLRSLDALHLATALQFGSEVTDFVTYDRLLAAAASAAGVSVVTPGQAS